jgi:type II secretory pathway component GspD/PulD (secretin)
MVTPRISDDGLVQIDVKAEKSAYQLAPGSGVPIFTDATQGNVIEAPVKDITTAQTTVAALSGQTIVLGGMITREQSDVVRKVPFLGDIPVIGRLFRVDLHQTQRKELLIFLTPTVVNCAGDSDTHAMQEASRISIRPDARIDLHRDFMAAGHPESLNCEKEKDAEGMPAMFGSAGPAVREDQE